MNVVHRCIRTPNIVLRALSYQAHYALRKHLRDGNPDYNELSDDEFDDREIHMNDI